MQAELVNKPSVRDAGKEEKVPGGGIERREFLKVLAAFGVSAFAAGGCGSVGAEGSGRFTAVATMTVIWDFVRNVGGKRVEAQTIVPLGSSPETYQPSPRDVERISRSKIVFENGFGLDGWVASLIQNAGGRNQRVVEVARGLAPVAEGSGRSEKNPHFWLDVKYAEHYVEVIRDALADADPEGAGTYRENARRYLVKLGGLDAYVRRRAGSIPKERRKLVTTHDAFPYFAGAYGFKLDGSILKNPEAEPSSREVAEVIRRIQKDNVPAVFTEPQFNANLAETISREANVRVYELYSDALVGDRSGDTYEAMMRTNVDRLVEGLG